MEKPVKNKIDISEYSQSIRDDTIDEMQKYFEYLIDGFASEYQKIVNEYPDASEERAILYVLQELKRKMTV